MRHPSLFAVSYGSFNVGHSCVCTVFTVAYVHGGCGTLFTASHNKA